MDLEIGHLVLRYTGLRVLDAGRVARLAASMAREGQCAPVLVVGDGVLVDGYHRVQALQELGREVVSAVHLEVDEPEALVLAWRLETGRRKSALEEAWLLLELMERHGRSQADLAREMRKPRSWVSERIGLIRALPEEAQEAVKSGRVPSHGALKALVPMARQDRAACARLAKALVEPITERQLERIYRAWRQADAQGRIRIEANPYLLLKAEEAVSEVPPDAQERLATDFEAIAGLCRRARRSVREGVFPRGNNRNRVLGRTWEQAREAFLALVEEVGRAGPRNADCDPATAS